MADCCHEHGCSRKQPILLRPGSLLTARWHVVTRYTVRDTGVIESQRRHQLDDETCATLTRWREAAAVLAELVRLKDGPRDDAYRAARDGAWERAQKVLESGNG